MKVQGLHKGKTIFVLGNGPSLNLLKNNRFLRLKHPVIGVNRACDLVSCDYIVFIDGRILDWHKDKFLATDSTIFCPEEFMPPPEKSVPESWQRFKRFWGYKRKEEPLSPDYEQGLRWSKASSMAAINLAYVMGASRIVMVGIDMNDNSHFYEDGPASKIMLFSEIILEDMEFAAVWLKERGVECLNCSPDSAVRGWDKVKLEDVLNETS